MDENEILESQETVEQPVEAQEVQTEPIKKTVPLNKFLDEKNKRKELERRIAEIERAAQSAPTKGLKEKYTALGLDDAFAEAIAADLAEMKAQFSRKPEKDIIAEELDDLVYEDEFFDDAKSYEKEIRDVIRLGKAVDVKSAYLVVRNPSERAKEIVNRNKAAPKAQPTSRPAPSSGDALTPEERAELEVWKQQDPSWDADKYKKYARNLTRYMR